MDKFRERYKEAKKFLKEAKSAIESPDLHNNPLELIKNSLEIYPDFAEAHYYMAFMLNYHYNDFNGAKNHLLKAIDNNPFFAAAYFELAMLQKLNFANYEAAKENFLSAIQNDGSYDEACYEIADLLEKRFSDYEAAKQYYLKAHKINPKSFLFLQAGLLLS